MQFIPDDPYSTDYDIKVIKSNFNSTDVGIGTTSIGFIDLTGSNKNHHREYQLQLFQLTHLNFHHCLLMLKLLIQQQIQSILLKYI